VKVSISERVAQASLILTGLMFVVPFLQPYHRFPIPSFYGEWLAFALGLAAGLGKIGRQAREQRTHQSVMPQNTSRIMPSSDNVRVSPMR